MKEKLNFIPVKAAGVTDTTIVVESAENAQKGVKGEIMKEELVEKINKIFNFLILYYNKFE